MSGARPGDGKLAAQAARAVMASGVPFAITHALGHMFTTDQPDTSHHA